MTHPEELLAGYVDGTLSSQERARRRCARGRVREVQPGGRARRRRPIGPQVARPEVPAPADIGSRAIRGSDGRGSGRRHRGTASLVPRRRHRRGRRRRAPGLHAGPAEGGPERRRRRRWRRRRPRRRGRDGEDARVLVGAATGIEIQHVNYDDASLTALASSYAVAGGLVRGWCGARRSAAPKRSLGEPGADRQGAGVHRAVGSGRDGRPDPADPGAVRGNARLPGGLRGRPRRGSARRHGSPSGSSRPTTAGSSPPPSRSCSRDVLARADRHGNRRAFPPMGGLERHGGYPQRDRDRIGAGRLHGRPVRRPCQPHAARPEGSRRRRAADAHDRRRELPRLRRRHPRPRADGADGEAGGAVRRRDPARCT